MVAVRDAVLYERASDHSPYCALVAALVAGCTMTAEPPCGLGSGDVAMRLSKATPQRVFALT